MGITLKNSLQLWLPAHDQATTIRQYIPAEIKLNGGGWCSCFVLFVKEEERTRMWEEKGLYWESMWECKADDRQTHGTLYTYIKLLIKCFKINTSFS